MTFLKLLKSPLPPCVLMTPALPFNLRIFLDLMKSLSFWIQGNKLLLNVWKTQPILIYTKPMLGKLRTAGGNLCLNIIRRNLDMMQKVQVDNSLD